MIVMVNIHMFGAHGIFMILLKATANLSNMFKMARMVTSDASCARLSIARRFLRNDLKKAKNHSINQSIYNTC